MKTLSDYKGNDAIELWADLLEPISSIFIDKQVAEVVHKGLNKIQIAQVIIKNHAKEAVAILTRIDDTPIDGLNIIIRLADLITEIGQNEDARRFFGFAAEQTSTHSGSVTENTEASEN